MWKKVLARAKVNLFFEVLRRREDGFHEVESLVVPISLADTVEVRMREDKEIRLTIEGAPGIPADATNLVVRAANLLRNFRNCQDTSGNSLPGVDIILQKRIPAEAGLGGGSSDAAATLWLLNERWQTQLSRSELTALSVSLGCDVPLFLGEFPVIVEGRGERLTSVAQGASYPTLHLVLVKPMAGLSTPAVYRNCEPRDVAGIPATGSVSALLDAWRRNDLPGVAAQLFNRLEVPAMRLLPELQTLRQNMEQLADPCLGFAMTGSGSACFGLCRDAQHAQNIVQALNGTPYWTMATRTTQEKEGPLP